MGPRRSAVWYIEYALRQLYQRGFHSWPVHPVLQTFPVEHGPRKGQPVPAHELQAGVEFALDKPGRGCCLFRWGDSADGCTTGPIIHAVNAALATGSAQPQRPKETEKKETEKEAMTEQDDNLIPVWVRVANTGDEPGLAIYAMQQQHYDKLLTKARDEGKRIVWVLGGSGMIQDLPDIYRTDMGKAERTRYVNVRCEIAGYMARRYWEHDCLWAVQLEEDLDIDREAFKKELKINVRKGYTWGQDLHEQHRGPLTGRRKPVFTEVAANEAESRMRPDFSFRPCATRARHAWRYAGA